MNLVLPLALLVFALVFVGCTSEVQRIREFNEAAEKSSVSTPPPEAWIPAHDLRTGDCISNTFLGGVLWRDIRIVPCSEPWLYQVVGTFNADRVSRRYPDEDFFYEQASDRCPSGYDFELIPTEDAWEDGTRTVICLRNRF